MGPDLDAAFRHSRQDGLGEGTIEGVVRGQIAEPLENSQMSEDLVTGDDARDVAAYVAHAAGVPGEDTAQLAQAGLQGATDGQQIFRAAGCTACHTLSDAGSRSDVGPNLDQLARNAPTRQPGMSAEEYVRQSILNPTPWWSRGSKT